MRMLVAVVAAVVWAAGAQTVRLYRQNSFSGSVITDTGLALSAASRTSDPTSIDNDISAERILDLDADHIFVSVYDDPQGTARRVERHEPNPRRPGSHVRGHAVG